jgi:diguanylate cyclase (GGDEF)-like protein
MEAMAPATTNSPESRLRLHRDSEHRRSFLSLRWLIVILAAYLNIFSHLNTPQFVGSVVFSLLYTGSNIVLALIPLERLRKTSVQYVIVAIDCLFVAATFYLLRVPGTYLHLVFLLIFILGVIWRELKLVLFSLLIISLLFGTFAWFRLFEFEIGEHIEAFLTLALFFIVSIFYVFLWGRLKTDVQLSSQILEEKRNADAMVDITRTLSSSLKTEEILSAIVDRVREIVDAKECWIVRLGAKTGKGEIIAGAKDPDIRAEGIVLDGHPELMEAFATRKMVLNVKADPLPVIVVPMVAQDTVSGLIYVQTEDRTPLSESNVRFFEVMATTAANALRNAHLFEEVEQRARTDFLTGLPNHRHFQTTLALELIRAQRHNHPLSLLMIDLDFLKEVNDRFGHPSGDVVIRLVAETIRASCRETDFAARYGGEEFTVILQETPLDGAIQAAERIREQIGRVRYPKVGNVTASIGISNYPVNALTQEDLIRVADQALYVAKKTGRDRVAYFNYQLITK